MTDSRHIDILNIVHEERERLAESIPDDLLLAIVRLEDVNVSVRNRSRVLQDLERLISGYTDHDKGE